ncbi:MAG: polysaccharide deacetylase [Symbiobacteriaceae bacterium]|jgi:peptidoglycan/xylan/chitin deacetylase (PgdA/CDA1 family)|nr:polysaccharide deacetylase [Symbiobacteriaceae bacterium]
MMRRAGGALLSLALLLAAGCAVTPAMAPKPPVVSVVDPPPLTPVVESTPPPAPPSPPLSPPEPKASWFVEGHWGPVYTDDAEAKERKVAVLTFDDGPSPEYTNLVLDTLKARGARAIFFVNGQAAQHPELIKRILAEGHLVGNHTMTHEDLRSLSRAEQYEQIAGLNDAVRAITGEQPHWFRAPFGSFNDDTLAILAELGMQLLNWSHGSGDWMDVHDGYKDPAILIHDVLAETPRNASMTPLHPGSIILFHDTLRHTAEALPKIMDGLQEKGYSFVLPEPSQP